MNTRPAVSILFVFLLLLVAAPPIVGSDDTRFAVDGEQAKGYVMHLASDDHEGRRSGTEGYRKAADWVAAKFREWGLAPAGEDGTFFQAVPMREFSWQTGVPELHVAGRPFTLDDGDFRVDSVSTAGTTIDSEVVFVGYGISAPKKGLDEYAGVDVQGKIALAFKGSPSNAPASRSMFGPRSSSEQGENKKDEWKDESTDKAKIRTAYDRGAAALLLFDPDASSDSGSRRFFSRRSGGGDAFKPERDFLCFTVEERVARAILKADPQESPSGVQRRIGNVRRGIREKKVHSRATGVRAGLAGYTTSVRHSKENGNHTAPNVIAKIEGSDPKLRNEYVIIGAHLDHVGMRDGYVRNGADDNASGSAVVMEVARVLAEGGYRPKRTVVFCCWAGEELGLLGLYHYTKTPCDGVTMDRTVAYFNLDMVGMGDTLRAPGGLNFPEVWEVIARDQDPEILEFVKPSEGGPGGSDHSGFIVKGIEAMALMTGGGIGHPDYHQPEDDPDKIEPEALRKSGQFVLQGVRNLADETEVNLLIENREARYKALRMRISNNNPDLTDGRWKVVTLDADNQADLRQKVLDRAIEMLEKPPSEQSTAASAARARFVSRGGARSTSRLTRSATRGVSDLGPFEGDVDLLRRASKIYGFGRVDIRGDDGAWVAEGRLTDSGRAAVGALEEEKIVVHLVSPSEKLLEDFLGAAGKPFLVTGDYAVTESMVDRIVDKNVVLGVNLDPKKPDEFIARLEDLKDTVGRRESFVAWVTSAEGLNDARAPLYLGLLEKGWAHREICGSRRGRGGIAGGNLAAVTGAAATSGRRMR